MNARTPIRLQTMPSWRCVVVACSILLGLLASRNVSGQAAQFSNNNQAGAPVILDRAVAVVNKHLILESDLEDEIRLSILEPNQGGELAPQRALQELISRTLIEQQIRQEDAQALAPTQEAVNARLAELRRVLPECVRQNCASDEGWKGFLLAHELTDERVEAYLRYRMEILAFIEQRFRQGIQISQQQVDAYYNDTLLPQYKAGETPPPLQQVAPRIQEILLQQQVNQLFSSWLTNLRQQGDVEVLDPALETADVQGGQGRADP
jgi:peptidyl-prolyl cis-trans isomerase SurA